MAAMLLTMAVTWAADWPQYQHDARRSGFTNEEVHPPYKVAWTKSFWPDRVARRTQAIICKGRVFVGTQHGTMFCLDAATGKEIWRFEGGGSIQHSAACDDGRVFFGSLDGCVYALDADTGRLLWKCRTDGPFTVAPLVVEGMVFMGNHRGSFYALNQRTGRIVWRFKIDAPILNTAAYDRGRIFFGGEDMRVYALEAGSGRLLWRSEKLWGMSMKDYCPVVHKGFVIVRPMTSFEAEIYTGVYSRYGSWPNNLPGGWWPVWGPGFKERYEKAVEERAGRMPKRLIEAQKAVIRHFKEMPEDQDMFVLDTRTGKQALIPPHFRVNSMHGPVTPPAEDVDGYLILPWVHINHCWARYDIERNLLVELIIPPRPTNADETLNVSCGGRYVFVFHCEEGNANYTGVYDLREKRWHRVPGAEVPWYDNLQSGANPVSIGEGHYFHILFNTLVARMSENSPAPADEGKEDLQSRKWRGGRTMRSSKKLSSSDPVRGPLRVHPENPRYFTDGSGRVVYLTGSHTWNNLQDIGPSDPPPPFDFDAYLDFLERYNHNFIRLWRWELTIWDTAPNGREGMHWCAPHPWPRTGPGLALDGKPKFDLEKFDEAYFKRLRARVEAAYKRGIYVSIMLFEGWGLQFVPDGWKAHPFHPANNINGINGDVNGDGRGLEVHELANPRVLDIQEAYVRKVIDTVNDFDNVLYEISNENHPASTEWQYHMIRFIKRYEQTKPKQHPVGMTFQYKGGSNATLFRSPADWISPNPEGGYRDDPPPADGSKVILSDTDHLWGIGGNQQWVWKSFCRGLNPIFMDPYDGLILGKPFDPQWEPIRRSLGYTRRYAESMDLANMVPRPELASTRYCLANPGVEYLVYLPEGGSVTVDLSAGNGPFSVEWFNPTTDRKVEGGQVQGGGRHTFKAPFKGDAALYLRASPRKRE